MTVVLTIMTPSLIVMTADSAVTLEFQSHREYERGRKSYFYDGIGCITVWGALGHNRVGQFVETRGLSRASHSVQDLGLVVDEYLHCEVRPHLTGVGEVGYHVAGFGRDGRPHLWTIFYGFDQRRSPGQTEPKYAFYPHEPPPDGLNFHYNGRNDLADPIIRLVLDQIKRAQYLNFDLAKPVDLVRLADFVVRFAAEITPEVGLPFIHYLISTNNIAARIKNESRCPIPIQSVYDAIAAADNTGT